MTEEQFSNEAISARLKRLADDAEGETVTLDWVLTQLDDRAFGLFLLVLALPCCLPFLYGLPQIVAFPMLFIAVQFMMGRSSPWLPERLGNREVSKAGLQKLAERAEPWLKRVEAISRPRLSALTHPPFERFVAVMLVIFCATILFPFPLTNSVPAFAVALVSFGLLQRDGVLVILGGIIGTVWIGLLLYAGAALSVLIRGWLGI